MTHPNPNNPSPEMIEAPVDRKLILAIDGIRTTLQEHDGNRPDCVYCRIFDHINAAYGEAVGEPIAAMQAQQPNPSLADALDKLGYTVVFNSIADAVHIEGAGIGISVKKFIDGIRSRAALTSLNKENSNA